MLNTRGMDDNARRQTGPPVSAPSQHMVQHPDAQRWSNGAGAGRHPPGRGMAGTVAYSGYYQETVAAFSSAMPRSTMSYQYGQVTQEPKDTGTCNPSLVYNIPHTSVQSTVYHTNQLLPLWQPTALRRPAGMAASYLLSEPTDTRTAPALSAQAVSSGASEVDPPVLAEESAVLDGQRSVPSTSGIPQASEAPEKQDSASTEMGEAYAQYQTTIKEIFTNIRNGVLSSASESLVAVSDWLLSNVTELGSPGLATNDPRLYHDRIKLWHDFNHAWLALLQKQKDMVGSGIALQDGQAPVREESLKKMGKEMIRLCDEIERYGLVDYEYGVWEEPIVEILTECLDLYENSDGSGDASLANPSASRLLTNGWPLKAKETLAPFRRTHPSVAVEVHHTTAANMRLQIDSAVDKVRTSITFLVDSTVILPLSSHFFCSGLTPFEDPGVVLVGTRKRGVGHTKERKRCLGIAMYYSLVYSQPKMVPTSIEGKGIGEDAQFSENSYQCKILVSSLGHSTLKFQVVTVDIP
ncbi:hypothetical protein PG991_014943 [Apiospora marii]|uniref:Uncharacterized protein n=1 Tax=Apiospora marii TaxID=335849 RepID=A0ABR1R3P0_9PEZI